jgi:hypothetical protein
VERPKPTAPAETAPAVLEPDTLAPVRNFTLSTEDRLRAFVQGVPGYIRRRRRIEDLQDKLQRLVATQADPAGSAEVMDGLAALNALIDQHNRYYPIEARLPIDVRTRRLIERGRPWQPLPLVTFEALASDRR